MEIIDRLDGRAFPCTLGLVARLGHRPLSPQHVLTLEEVYCAELVATTYQHMGLLPSAAPAELVDPGRFWSGDRLGLVEPFELGGEIPVR